MKQNMKEAIGLSLKRYNDTYMKAANDRIDNIVSQAGTDNTEIVDARIDSAGVTHTTLNNRILAETKMNDQHLVSCSGEHITAENTMGGSITNLEVLGNTIQNEEDLADIKSVGELQEDGTYKMSISSCGKNLFYGGLESGTYQYNNGVKISSTTEIRSVRKIKVNPNSNYIISSNKPTGNIGVYYYGSKENFIKAVYDDGQKVVTTEDTHFIAFRFVNLDLDRTVQIEEGTVATSYEPYQENKCDILLPCQLEKVGDVSDRLYYDDVEKAWCIEKNVVKIPLYESVNKINGDWETLYFSKTLSFDKVKNASSYCISSLLNYNGQDISTEDTITQLCIFGHANNFECRIRLRKDEFPNITTNEDYIKWATENDFYILLQSASPQKIVLPLSIQIQLNSFFGTTHVYMESGEVEGTIKCKIPKSLGATVQSLNNKTDILSDRIEAIEGLKDSQNMKYETDKGYLVCKETKNGVIDDLKIEGKTLVNLASTVQWGTYNGAVLNEVGVDNVTFTTVGYAKVAKVFNLVPNTDYIVTFIKSSGVSSYYRHTDNPNTSNAIVLKDGATITTSDTGILNLSFEGEALTNATVTELMVVKATEYRKNQAYFEGLKSVGEDVDEIEVLSRKEDGNLLCLNKNNLEYNALNIDDLSLDYNINGIEWKINKWSEWEIKQDLVVIPGIPYYISCDMQNANLSIYNNDVFLLNIAENTNNKIFNPTTNKIQIRYRANSLNTLATIKNLYISNRIKSSDLKCKQDKKQILFYNSNGELEPIQELHEWDSIEKHSDNKWYYHKRSGKVVLNGSEDWSNGIELTNTTKYETLDFNNKVKPHNSMNDIHPLCCDKFIVTSDYINNNIDCESIGQTVSPYNTISIRISNTKLSSNNVEGFKQWLQANPVTVVYQLAQEEVYEITPLHLDSYANETLILCNSGAISPKMEFSITSHINELVKAYGERVNLLEEKVYQYMVTQNRMQLASTYSADSVTFKVDYFSLCGDEENYDEDLYNLILNNILVGKDNYNYDKMFTMILDYASWNQISWEQFDILVGLMDIQHNPPIEELPPEDVIEEDIIENETPVE